MEWPPWQGQEVARLKELYGKPAVLRAAIDDQKDAVSLTESLFPGVPESAVKARADALFQWFSRTERAAKVARRETLTQMWETLPGEHSRVICQHSLMSLRSRILWSYWKGSLGASVR